MSVNGVDTNGYQEPINQLHALNVEVHIGIRRGGMYDKRAYMKKYRQRPEVKRRRREYRNRPEAKQCHREYYKKYNQRVEVKQRRREYQNRTEVKQHRREYYKKSEIIKHRKKYYEKNKQERYEACKKALYKRRNNYGWIKLWANPFPTEIKVDFHHLLSNFYSENKQCIFTIPIPKITHRYVGGNTSDRVHWLHNTEWIKKLYNIDVKQLLNGYNENKNQT